MPESEIDVPADGTSEKDASESDVSPGVAPENDAVASNPLAIDAPASEALESEALAIDALESDASAAAPPDVPDVLPIWARQTLMLLWLLLFGGRWLLAPALLVAGLLAPTQLDMLDQLVLLKLYLVLLVTTIAVVALRAVRGAQSGIPSQRSASVQGASQAAPPVSVASAGGDEVLD